VERVVERLVAVGDVPTPRRGDRERAIEEERQIGDDAVAALLVPAPNRGDVRRASVALVRDRRVAETVAEDERPGGERRRDDAADVFDAIGEKEKSSVRGPSTTSDSSSTRRSSRPSASRPAHAS